MELEQTNAEILREFSDPHFQQKGLGILITGTSMEKRSAIAELALEQSLLYRPDRSVISGTLFELIARYGLGLYRRLSNADILLIKDLGELSKAQLDAVDVLIPGFDPTRLLEVVLDGRSGWYHRLTMITTEYERAELDAQFSERLTSLVGSVGFSIRV
jgi:hypothetical protein